MATFKIVLPVIDTFFTGNQDGNQDDTINVIINNQIDEGVNGGVNGGVSGGVNGGVNGGARTDIIKPVKTIIAKEGSKANDLAVTTGKSIRTTQRYLKLIKDMDIIEFRGSPKTGGYFITQAIRNKIKDQAE